MNELLCGIEKPGRYTGGELNVIIKENADLRMAISFPDLYEVGMSNAGIQVLYARVNALEGAACERVFAAAPDFEKRLRDTGTRLFTLETRTPLAELDALGFNLSHELLYTNVLQILDLGGIPLLRAERRDGDPLVLAGGECASNPAPMGDFIDAFFAGDGEEGIAEIAASLLESKAAGLSRVEKLERLSGIAGVFVPSMMKERAGNRARKRVYRGKSPAGPAGPVVPNIRITQERAAVDITRGCGNLCAFCHAGFYDLPYRSLDPGCVRDAVLKVLDNTGYSEVTLSSLSVSDYAHLAELLNDLVPELTRRGVSLTLPSLRVDRETIPIIEKISGVRRSSLTFAVESATEELRRRANKRLSLDDLKDIVREVQGHGWKLIKLYFMIGLPGSEHVDEAGDIITLLKELAYIGKKRLEMNVTVSPFVPKPHTPFQREAMRDRDYMKETVRRIRQGAPRSAKVKSHDVDASLLEGVLARGDERLGSVILACYNDGCRFDSWSEHFRFSVWERNMESIAPDWKKYLAPRAGDEALPWGVIETGFERLVELRKGHRASNLSLPARVRGAISDAALKDAFDDFTRRYAVSSRVRLVLSKEGDARYVPHLDFVEIVKRALRMAGMPVSFTQGFNKRERLAAGFPLPLGVESESEIFDLDLWDSAAPDDMVAGMNLKLPAGIRAVRCRELAPAEKDSIMGITAAASYRIAGADEGIRDSLTRGLQEKWLIHKETKKGAKEVPFDEAVLRHCREGDDIILVLKVGSAESVRVDQVVASLTGLGAQDLCGVRMIKTAQYHLAGGELEVIE
jgi:radical SAM family uncharacterized protein/radical SAM-linked protein